MNQLTYLRTDLNMSDIVSLQRVVVATVVIDVCVCVYATMGCIRRELRNVVSILHNA